MYPKFTGIYNRYKGHDSATHNYDATEKFGLVGKIAMFLVPGIAFFIFLPSCLFTYFEDWPYVRSVYYSFVTLTTIGFGDFVPTFQDGQVTKLSIRLIPMWRLKNLLKNLVKPFLGEKIWCVLYILPDFHRFLEFFWSWILHHDHWFHCKVCIPSDFIQ